jgi:hypothetical protein
MCRSWTSATPGRPAIARADQVRVQHSGAPGTLQEDPAGFPDQPVPGLDHQAGHDQRGERIGAGEPGEHHHKSGDRGRDERVQVVENVLERALDVQAGPVRLADQPRRASLAVSSCPGRITLAVVSVIGSRRPCLLILNSAYTRTYLPSAAVSRQS